MRTSEDLPYTLSSGVTATEAGLKISTAAAASVFLGCVVQQYRSDIDLSEWEPLFGELSGIVADDLPFHILAKEENCIYEADAISVAWPTVAERLRYREGEPWCHAPVIDDRKFFHCMSPDVIPLGELTPKPLGRLAAILCDDAADFRVLYDCIQEHNHE